MPATLKRIYSAQPGTTDTLLYTVPASTSTTITAIHVGNTTGTAATITLGLNSGAALAAANQFWTAVSVAGNDSIDWTGAQVLGASETIRALQGTASALTVHISGVEVT